MERRASIGYKVPNQDFDNALDSNPSNIAPANSQRLSIGEVERALSQTLQCLIRDLAGRSPRATHCHLFANYISSIIEQSVTPAESVLLDREQTALATQVRLELNAFMQQQMCTSVEQWTGVGVQDVLTNTDFDAQTTGMLIVLAALPQVRNLPRLPKQKLFSR